MTFVLLIGGFTALVVAIIFLVWRRHVTLQSKRIHDKESNDSLPIHDRLSPWGRIEPFAGVALRHGRLVDGIELCRMGTASSDHSLLGSAGTMSTSATHLLPSSIPTSPYLSATAQLTAHRSRFVETGFVESTDGSPGPVCGGGLHLGRIARHPTVQQIIRMGLDDEAMGRPDSWDSGGADFVINTGRQNRNGSYSERTSTQNLSHRWMAVESVSGRPVMPTQTGRSDAVRLAFQAGDMDFAAIDRHRLSHTAETGQFMRRPAAKHETRSVADGGTFSGPPSVHRPSPGLATPTSGFIERQGRVPHVPVLPHQSNPIGLGDIQAPPQAHGRPVQVGPRAPLQTGDVNQRVNPLMSSPVDGQSHVLSAGPHRVEGRNAGTFGEPAGGPIKEVEKSKPLLKKKESISRLA